MTDEPEMLERVLKSGVPANQMHAQLQALRLQVLGEVLPVPLHELRPTDIRRFKDKHGSTLGDFRRRVERELVTLAQIQNEELKRRQLELFVDEARERIHEIRSWMHNARWRDGLGRIGGIVAAAQE